jgi:Caspase domain
MRSPPDSADQAEPPPKRFLIAAGTSIYKKMPDRPLPSVEGDLSRIVGLFVGKLGYERALLSLSENQDSTYFADKLDEWLRSPDRKTTDQIVLYYSGHGFLLHGDHYLMLTNSDESRMAVTAFPTANLGRMLAGTSIRQMMVILDTCQAGAGSGDFQTSVQKFLSSLSLIDPTPRCFYVLAAARPREEASQSVFSEAFVRAAGERHSSYDGLVESINREFEMKGLHQKASVSSLNVESSPPFLLKTRHRAEPKSRQKHRDKVRAALSEVLSRLFDDLSMDPRTIAEALMVEKADGSQKIGDTILDHLLDHEKSIPLLNKLIRKTVEKRASEKVTLLENCLDLILPYHFAPAVIADASRLINEDGGGFIQGVVITKCGAELLMAALDQLHAQFNPKDPELGGQYAIERGVPPLDKMSTAADAKRFLADVLKIESEETQVKSLMFDELDNDRKTYCIVRLMEDDADYDYMVKVLEQASEIRPELPILLLTSKGKDKGLEEVYLKVLRRRFNVPKL